MKNQWLITFRSVTFAQRGEKILRNSNIPCQILRTPKHLTQRGCGYCLRLRGLDVPVAVELFHGEQLPYGKLYAIKDDGSTQERML